MSARSIRGPVRVHCGYHKCLTMYSRGIYKRATQCLLPPGKGFKHFHHRLDRFYEGCTRYRVTSVSGHALDLERFEDVRVVRFVRDPRDLLVSRYYYHLRGAESWSTIIDPKPEDWKQVNGVIPSGMTSGESMQSLLSRVSLERGMEAELEFRANHFQSMLMWPDHDPRVRVFKYEEILGNELAVFREIFDFFELPRLAQILGSLYAKRHTAGRSSADNVHIRDPRAGQWRDVLPKPVVAMVNAQYGPVLERYGYARG